MPRGPLRLPELIVIQFDDEKRTCADGITDGDALNGLPKHTR